MFHCEHQTLLDHFAYQALIYLLDISKYHVAYDLAISEQKRITRLKLSALGENHPHPICPHPHEDYGVPMGVFVGGLFGVFDFVDCLETEEDVTEAEEKVSVGALDIVVELHGGL